VESAISEPKTSVKVVGANGQISLGKGYAGRQVLVEQREPGVWLVRTAIVIPENEQWLHSAPAAADLNAALDWAAKNKPRATNLDALFTQEPRDGQQPARQKTRKTRSQQSGVSKKPARSR
jgi:hypothetical protein